MVERVVVEKVEGKCDGGVGAGKGSGGVVIGGGKGSGGRWRQKV